MLPSLLKGISAISRATGKSPVKAVTDTARKVSSTLKSLAPKPIATTTINPTVSAPKPTTVAPKPAPSVSASLLPVNTNPLTGELQDRAKQITSTLPGAVDFEKRFPFEKYFFNEDLAREQARQQADPYFRPIEERGLRDINRSFSDAGLLRSGATRQQRGLYQEDIGQQRELTLQELINNRLQEAIDEQARLQRLAETDVNAFNLAAGALTPLDLSMIERLKNTPGMATRDPMGMPTINNRSTNSIINLLRQQ